MISSIIWSTLLLMGFSSLHVILKFKPFISLVTPAISASVHYTILLNSYNVLIALCSNFLPFPLPTLLLFQPCQWISHLIIAIIQDYGIGSNQIAPYISFS